MNYPQALDYLLTFADFERSGRFADRADVNPMQSLLAALGDPHWGRLTVHIAGSKGKGSSAAMIESILRQAGVRTGLYTSPHLHSYCERIRIDGRPIKESAFAHLAGLVRGAQKSVELQSGRELVTFDLLTALGFLAFRQNEVQVQIIEVGLGGRLDSTNVFAKKEVSVITPLSLEHTAILGNTIRAIAREKAGIITKNCTVVLARQDYAGAEAVIRKTTAVQGSLLLDVARDYPLQHIASSLRGQRLLMRTPAGRNLKINLSLLGQHQAENAATAVAAVEALPLRISDEAITRGLGSVRWPGRFEVVRTKPVVVLDGAHNRDSARRLRETIAELLPGQKVIFIVATSADKDVKGIATELLMLKPGIIVTESSHQRAMPSQQLAGVFERFGHAPQVANSIPQALESALAASKEKTVICLVGSFFAVAEGREYLSGRKSNMKVLEGRA